MQKNPTQVQQDCTQMRLHGPFNLPIMSRLTRRNTLQGEPSHCQASRAELEPDAPASGRGRSLPRCSAGHHEGSSMPRSILVRCGVAAATVGFIVIVKAPLESWVGTGPPLILFIPALTFSAWFGGFGPGLLATALSVISCNYLYFPPIGSLRVESGYDQVQLGVFVLEGILTSSLMQQLLDARRQSETS